jgi:hypothetical protein
VDLAFPAMDDVCAGAPESDPVARLEHAGAVLDRMMLANEGPLRLMLAQALQRGLSGEADTPARQNRRTPLIEAALEPARSKFTPAALERLAHASALVTGTESMIVFKDVLQIDEAKARKVKRWAIRALVDAARRPEGR